MEDGLVLVFMSKIRFLRICLNPCCSGQWSRTLNPIQYGNSNCKVLILIVVEDGLVRMTLTSDFSKIICLNPCYSGRWSRTPNQHVERFGLSCLNPCYSGRWSRTQQYLNCQII